MVGWLRVESITDTTPDPYGQPGFSALVAYVKADDAELVQKLQQAADTEDMVIVRCATLEVQGRVGKMQFVQSRLDGLISILVENLRYFKPRGEGPVERRRLPPRAS